MKRFLSCVLALMMALVMMSPVSLAEEAETEEGIALIELEETDAALTEEAPEAAAEVTVTESDGALTAAYTGDGEAEWHWQRVSAEAYAAQDAEALEAEWAPVAADGARLIPESGYAYRAIAETGDGLTVSDPVVIENGEELSGKWIDVPFSNARIEGAAVIDLTMNKKLSADLRKAQNTLSLIWNGEGEIEWESTNPGVLEISADGRECVMEPIAEGSAKVRAWLKDDPDTKVSLDIDIIAIRSVAFEKTSLRVSTDSGEPVELALKVTPAKYRDLFMELYFGEYARGFNTSCASTDRNAADAVMDGGVCRILPVSAGKATVTFCVASAATGKAIYKATAKITAAAGNALSAVRVSSDEYFGDTVYVGDTFALKAVCEPANAENVTYTWKSSKESVVYVDQNGYVQARGVGSATVSVTAVQDKTKKTATVKISVADPTLPAAVTILPTRTMSLDLNEQDSEKRTLTASVEPETADAECTWKSSSEKVLKVEKTGRNEACLTPVAEGTAAVTVTAANGKTKKTSTIKVTVYDSKKPTGITLEQTGTVSLVKDAALQLNASVLPATADGYEVTYKSSAPQYADVDPATGLVTGVAEGTAAITATVTKGKVRKSASVKVSVYDPKKPTGITVDHSGTVSLTEGNTLQLSSTVLPATAEGYTVTYKSSSATCAAVDPDTGLVTALKPGTATITATVTKDKVRKSASVKVKVIADPNPLRNLELSETDLTVDAGETGYISLIITPATYSAKTEVGAKIDNALIADAKLEKYSGGFRLAVTGKNSGTAKITVTVTRGGVSRTVTATVTVPEE